MRLSPVYTLYIYVLYKTDVWVQEARVIKTTCFINTYLISFKFDILIVIHSRKEVFQPHLPVRLPCYDLAPITSFTLGRPLRSQTSGAPGFHGLTGGVYKARERIHRAMADARLLANPASWGRVADPNPNYDAFSWLNTYCYMLTLCMRHCNTCVAPDVRAVLIWRHPHLPHTLRWQYH